MPAEYETMSVESTKSESHVHNIIVILLWLSVINYILLLNLYGKRENCKSHGCLQDRTACSIVHQIMSIFYCSKSDLYHLPHRHVWTIRQSVNWYKDMYNRAIWKLLYCPILISMTFIRLSSYRSRTRIILLVWRQNENILLNTFFSFSYTQRLVYYRISVRIITSSLFIKRSWRSEYKIYMKALLVTHLLRKLIIIT